jgi:hypothetical protein
MQCTRCTGLTVPELIIDGGVRRVVNRCVSCGDLVDRVILRNRTRRVLPKPGRARTPVFRWKRCAKNKPSSEAQPPAPPGSSSHVSGV